MHSFDKDGIAPLTLDVEPIVINNRIEFKISESHLSLEKYYLEDINIITPNELCESGVAFPDRTKGAFSVDGLIVWEYQPQLPEEKIGVITNIIYGFKGKSKKLQKNTLYVLQVRIKKIDGQKYQRIGYDITYFYINSKGDVVVNETSKGANRMCKKFGRQVSDW